MNENAWKHHMFGSFMKSSFRYFSRKQAISSNTKKIRPTYHSVFGMLLLQETICVVDSPNKETNLSNLSRRSSALIQLCLPLRCKSSVHYEQRSCMWEEGGIAVAGRGVISWGFKSYLGISENGTIFCFKA